MRFQPRGLRRRVTLIAALGQVQTVHGDQLAIGLQNAIAQVAEPDVSGLPVLLRGERRYAIDLLAARTGIRKPTPIVGSAKLKVA
jgi:hypothetical protein